MQDWKTEGHKRIQNDKDLIMHTVAGCCSKQKFAKSAYNLAFLYERQCSKTFLNKVRNRSSKRKRKCCDVDLCQSVVEYSSNLVA